MTRLLAVAPAGCAGREIRLGVGGRHAQVKAGEAPWVGDSRVTMPGTQHTRVRALAGAAGAGPSDDYVGAAPPATTVAMIADQNNTQEVGATKVQVLSVDGGRWDTIVSDASDAAVATVSHAFTQPLTEVGADGSVQQLIYLLYPELPTIPGVAAPRPVRKQACDASTVPRYVLDLQPRWSDRPDYTDICNIQASESGAQAIADAVWDILQRNCIAQSSARRRKPWAAVGPTRAMDAGSIHRLPRA